MSRRRRITPRPGRTAQPPVPDRVETGADGYPYEVRPVTGGRATKTYRCPGCDHEIRSGTPHVVVWPATVGSAGSAGTAGVDDRRHWHTSCWANRATRGPTRKWS